MRSFTEKEIEKYYAFAIDVVGDEKDIAGRCTSCGRELYEVELPAGPEKKVTCLDCREYFESEFEVLEEIGDI